MISQDNIAQYEQFCNEYLKTHPNVHGIGIGKKIKNGQQLDELSMIFSVEEKKPISELLPEEIIPQNISINNDIIISDVVQNNRPITIGCKDWVPGQKLIDGFGTGTNATAEQNLHRVSVRPLVGGISITEQSSLPTSFGTLGCLAIDNEDGTVVGLSNSHVVCDCYIEPEDQLSIYNFNSSGDPIIQPALYEPYNGSVTSLPSNQLINKIGTVKRYASSNFDNVYFNVIANYIDASVISIDTGKATSASFGILGFNEATALPFATTSEINSLISNNCPLAISSRTTGAKNVDCGIIVTELNASTALYSERCLPKDKQYASQKIESLNPTFDFWKGGQRKILYYNDVVKFAYADGSSGVAIGGDSGSAVIALLPGGVRKIVGLVFAGEGVSGNYGYFCRIDRVAQILNVSQWNGNLNFSNPSTWQYITKSVVSPDPENTPTDLPLTIIEGGKKYWRIGTSQSATSPITTSAPATTTTTTTGPTTTTIRPTTTTTVAATTTPSQPPILSSPIWSQYHGTSINWDVSTISYNPPAITPTSVKVEYFNTVNNQWIEFPISNPTCEIGFRKTCPTCSCSYTRGWAVYRRVSNSILIYKYNSIVIGGSLPVPRTSGDSRKFRISFGYSGVYGTPSEFTVTT
jgi:hypothetical protein